MTGPNMTESIPAKLSVRIPETMADSPKFTDRVNPAARAKSRRPKRPRILSRTTERKAAPVGTSALLRYQIRKPSPPKVVGKTWLKNTPISTKRKRIGHRTVQAIIPKTVCQRQVTIPSAWRAMQIEAAINGAGFAEPRRVSIRSSDTSCAIRKRSKPLTPIFANNATDFFVIEMLCRVKVAKSFDPFAKPASGEKETTGVNRLGAHEDIPQPQPKLFTPPQDRSPPFGAISSCNRFERPCSGRRSGRDAAWQGRPGIARGRVRPFQRCAS